MPRSCCQAKDAAQRRLQCPQCHQHAHPVSRQTMLHQLCFPHNQNMSEDGYRFCSNRDCSVGYFSTEATIDKSQLRAYQPGSTTMLCHCFDISEGVYRTAFTQGQADAVKAWVTQQTKARLCACEAKNPSGRCCLADFQKIERQWQEHDC